MSGGYWIIPVKDNQTASDESLIRSYTELRYAGFEFDNSVELAESDGTFTDKELKQLDKATVLVKLGFKLIKYVLRSRGFKGKLKPPVKIEIEE